MWQSLGYVTTTPGQPVRVTNNQTNPSLRMTCHAIFFQQVRTNTGFILVGRSALNEGTGVDLNAVLPVPTNNSLPNATVGIPDAMNAMNAAEYYVDFTQSGDKCLVSILIL